MSDTRTAKFRLTFTATYLVNLDQLKESYGTEDVHEALQIDIKQYADDPGLFFDDSQNVVVSGQVIEDLP